MIGVGELVVLAGVVLLLYWALTPLRRWLEARFARALRGRSGNGKGRIVVLERRRDGAFGRGDADER